jgi:hypothetical protein
MAPSTSGGNAKPSDIENAIQNIQAAMQTEDYFRTSKLNFQN